MRTSRFYRNGFLIAAVYDLFLGFVFFLFYKSIYSLFAIDLPSDPEYLHLSAAFVFAQGLLYYYVYRDLKRNVDIVKAGLGYKIAYTGVAFYYWASGDLPHPIFAIFGILDVLFIVFFSLYLRDYRSMSWNPS